MSEKKSEKYLDILITPSYVIVLASLIYSWRAITSIGVMFILVITILKFKKSDHTFFTKDTLNLFVIGCFLLYLLKCFSLLNTHNIKAGIKDLQQSSGLIFIPLALYGSRVLLNVKLYTKLMTYYTAIIFSASLYCLIVAFSKYLRTREQSVFFYHDLVNPISQHAILFSILLFAAVIFLFDCLSQERHKARKLTFCFLIAYFSFFLFLLSSKLVLALYLLFAVYSIFVTRKYILKSYISILSFSAFLFLSVFILSTKNPISNRFRDVTSGNLSFIKQKKFTQGDYFNGLQFRLLQWRFVFEILNENQSWLIGVSPGDAQSYLDQKYLSTGMYIGGSKIGDRGFLGYKTHNEFLQNLLEMGLIGLASFIFIYFQLIMMAFKNQNIQSRFIILSIIAFCVTDAVLSTQYGVFLFTFFPPFLYTSLKPSH